jgi:hypothetical protein
MAIQLTPVRALQTTQVSLAARSVRATPAARATGTIRQPESATRQSFRSIATAAASAPAGSQSVGAAPAASIVALFAGGGANPGQSAPAATSTPTVESAFGSDPWLNSPSGLAPDGTTYNYNSQYFATPQTAAAVAQMLGGTVVQANEITSAPGSTFQQQQPNEMVKLSNGALVNPGLVAGFYTHGYPQSVIDQMIANEVTNVSANT